MERLFNFLLLIKYKTPGSCGNYEIITNDEKIIVNGTAANRSVKFIKGLR